MSTKAVTWCPSMETAMSALPVSPMVPFLFAVRSGGDVVTSVGGIVGTVGKVACSAGDTTRAVDEVVCSIGEVVCSVSDVVDSRRSCKGLPVATLPPEVAAVSFPAQGSGIFHAAVLGGLDGQVTSR